MNFSATQSNLLLQRKHRGSSLRINLTGRLNRRAWSTLSTDSLRVAVLSKALEQSVNLIPWSMRRRIKDVPLVAALHRWFFGNFLSGKEFLHRINQQKAVTRSWMSLATKGVF